jgi:16S rRNA (guanine527-N7)-methyltransferase
MDSAEAIFHYFPNLSATQKTQFKKLGLVFFDWNNKINLISRKDIAHFYERHVLHSLGIAKVLDFLPGSKVLDIGTGGGFPGLPLAILYPGSQFILVDSIQKKIKAVNGIIEELEIKNATGVHSRAEKVKGSFDFIISRAVTRLNRFIPWTHGKINSMSRNKINNGILYLKGGELSKEIVEAGVSAKIIELSDHFNGLFFETKKVVYIPYQ